MRTIALLALLALVVAGCARLSPTPSPTGSSTTGGLVTIGGGDTNSTAPVPTAPFHADGLLTIQGQQTANGYGSTSANCLPFTGSKPIRSGTVQLNWTPESAAAQVFEALVMDGPANSAKPLAKGHGDPGFEVTFEGGVETVYVLVRPYPSSAPAGVAVNQAIHVDASGLADDGAAVHAAAATSC